MGLLRLFTRPPMALAARPTRRTWCLGSTSSFSTDSVPPSTDDAIRNKKLSNDTSEPKPTKLTHAQRVALLVPTLQTFHARHGHFFMHYRFIVPTADKDEHQDADQELPPYPLAAQGLTLGITLHRLFLPKNIKTRIKHERTIQALADIGFPVDGDLKQLEWNYVKREALRVYQELYGDCVVPHLFVVPTNDTRWPLETRGLKLGLVVDNLRHCDHRSLTPERRQNLKELQTDWDFKPLLRSERLALLAPTLQVFRATFGHIIMPYNFVVPTDDDAAWPPKARGERLGMLLHSIMTNESEENEDHGVIQELADIGFPVDVDWKEYVWEHQRFAALRVYRELHGDCLVPSNFIVPTGDERWPIETRGLHLGNVVLTLRANGPRFVTQTQRDGLESLDFSWDVHETHWSENVLPALVAHKHVFGHCRVAQAFVVPSHAPWPSSAWGLRLGDTVNSIRSKGSYAKQIERDAPTLEALGFVWDPIAYRWETVLVPGFETYFAQHGSCHVPTAFRVPRHAPWPEETWGCALGVAARNMKYYNYYAEFRKRDAARLEKIAFEKAMASAKDRQV